MFGASAGGFGGFGQQQHQQQQQQQQQQQAQQPTGGLFGGFGSTPAFGAPATPQFGQPQQQQQNTGFGGFGAPASSSAFGAPAAAPSFGGGGNSLFGSPAVGGGSGFSFGGGSSAFGAPKTTAAPTGLFGAKPAQSFGFGAQPAASGGGLFGGSAPAFGAAQPIASGSGTGQIPFAETVEEIKDAKTNSFESHVYQTITCMDAYKAYSLEELRLQDYTANRKVPTAAAPGFGGGFGSTQTAFGAPQQQAGGLFGGGSGGGFGAQAPPAPAFGQAFGQQQQQPTAFGQQPQQPQQAVTSLFGAPAPASNPFGAQGGFGQPQQQQQQTPAPAFGGFGATAPKAPGFTFGTPAASAAPTTSLFGAPQAPAQAGGMFGQPAASPVGGGLFGAAAPAAGGFSFGAAAKPLFGAAPATTSPFSAAPKPAFSFAGSAPGGGLFGTSAPAPVPSFGGAVAPTTGLFGSTPNTFGQVPQQQQVPAFGAGGLFGAAKPPTTSLFGAPATTPGGGLFSSQPTAQPSLFQSGGLGNSFQNSYAAPNSQLPNNVSNNNNINAVASSEDINAYGSNPLFAMMATSPANRIVEKKKPPMWRLPDHSARSATKITRLRGFGQSSNSSSMTGSSGGGGGGMNSPLNLSRSSTPLGFGSGLGASSGGGGGAGGGRDSPLRLVNGIGEDAALSPSAFVSRSSVKKLVIDRKSIDHHLAASTTTSPQDAPPRSKDASSSNLKGKVTFNPEIDFTAQRNGSNQNNDSDFTQSTPSKKTTGGGSSNNLGESSEPDTSTINSNSTASLPRRSTAARPLKHGDYFSHPSLETLQQLPASSLRSLPDLIVGRVGYGQVAFQQPVDLTTLQSVQDLYGNIIVFEERNLTVYPADYEDIKPTSGQGLNVEAIITLEKCWPVDKATRLPIKDEKNSRLIAHVKRLRNLEDTSFIDFDAEKGRWVFKVDGF